MWQIYIVSKKTGTRIEIIATALSEKSAENLCEAWGWNYCDADGSSYWIDYEYVES